MTVRLVADATTCRALAVAGWLTRVVEFVQQPLLVAPAVISHDGAGMSEVERRIRRCQLDLEQLDAGGAEYGRRMHELVSLEALLRAGPELIEPLRLTEHESRIAIGLADPDATWRSKRGLLRAPLGAGEAESIAVAIARSFTFATDDRAAQRAYATLGGARSQWTGDLVLTLVDNNVIADDVASRTWEQLRGQHRFRVPPWQDLRPSP